MVEEWHDCEESFAEAERKVVFVDPSVEGKKHRAEWCAAMIKYRCMRCGRSNKMRMPG